MSRGFLQMLLQSVEHKQRGIIYTCTSSIGKLHQLKTCINTYINSYNLENVFNCLPTNDINYSLKLLGWLNLVIRGIGTVCKSF